ncbi:SAM-dependent methyltransferase [Leifsonia sp. AK011]|uniref:class I SAM-dependent DNA methyltransferase n=1 Tax=Leifsonia sp. AK011 TaxID=2723075 RepID=UPI0015CAEE38|nr:SAM-dependent methyltransferase [Leifsonia sp. AK011]NYF09091.1 SAM-dependent methyltransferase [Leifsonia sp. AK011]
MSLDAGYFDELYEQRDDPWSLADRWYERRKRALTVAMLPHERYASALEIGCSIGLLTELLARRSDRLLSTDIAQRPIDLAREHVGPDADHVEFRVMRAPDEWPSERFDLIVVSEVGYYLDEESLGRLATQARDSLTSGGVVLACHWRHPVPDYPLRGDRVHEILTEASGLIPLAEYVDADVRLAVLAEPGARSIAAVDGSAP